MPTKTKTKIQKGGRNVWNSSRLRQDTNLEGVGEDYQEKASTITLGTSHHLSHNISEGINYGDNGCLNNFSIICDNYGDVWKVHQTNVATSPRIGGGVANLEITLYDFQQITSHIAKHTPLQGVPSGTHTPLTRCDKVHAPLQGVPDGAPTPLTRCVKVHLGQVCCEDILHLELQSSRSRPRGWKWYHSTSSCFFVHDHLIDLW